MGYCYKLARSVVKTVTYTNNPIFPKSQNSDFKNTSGPRNFEKKSSEANCSCGIFLSVQCFCCPEPGMMPYLSLQDGSPLFFGSKRLFKHFNVLLAIRILIAKSFKLCL